MVTIDRQAESITMGEHDDFVARFATVHGALEQFACVAVASLMVSEARIELQTDAGRLTLAAFGDPVDRPAYRFEVPIRALTGETIAYFIVLDPNARETNGFDLEVIYKLADSAQRKLMLAWSDAGPRSVL
ncbi:hypothetical protein EV140_0987 [Microcella alkaliphila]|uniref:Uncharacterized protein n=1 Tax=Microcella alkaliphila TaxID=279828 RepID=A0A4V6MBW2_9MICO|nr:hypothetical protein [Microcella alkaliphila]RZT62459.1 hypothetical protein EV140_0987 [Microcella alkaliphila]